MIRKIISERVVGGTIPRYMYHGTSKKNATEIKRRGLTASGVDKAWDESENVVYLTTSYMNAFTWGWKVDDTNCVVCQIDTKYLDQSLISRDWNAEGDGMFGGRPSDEWSSVNWDNLQGENFEYNGEIPANAIKIIDCSEAARMMTEWRKSTVRKTPEQIWEYIQKNYKRILDTTFPGDDTPILLNSFVYTLKEIRKKINIEDSSILLDIIDIIEKCNMIRKIVNEINKRIVNKVIESNTKWFVVQEDDAVFNVFSSDDFDENGDLIGYEGQEGYNIEDYDIVAYCKSSSEAFRMADKLTRDAEESK